MGKSAEFLQQLNKSILAVLDGREKELTDRESKARRVLEECATERLAIRAQRASIAEAERIQLAALEAAELEDDDNVPPDENPPTFHVGLLPPYKAPAVPPNSVGGGPASPQDNQKLRARIGPQRYAILTALREESFLTADAISLATRLTPKRVKDQLRVDLPRGIVAMETIRTRDGEVETYLLTHRGSDLLSRFENYKNARGEELPGSLDGAFSELEGETEDEDPDELVEEKRDDTLDDLLA